MNKPILLLIVLTVMILSILFFVGADIKEVEHDGHLYIIRDRAYGTAMIHSPKCQCQKP